jgi:hypothetical protein
MWVKARAVTKSWGQRQQNVLAQQPFARIHHHVENRPARLVEINILHLADFAIAGLYGEVLQFFHGM